MATTGSREQPGGRQMPVPGPAADTVIRGVRVQRRRQRLLALMLVAPLLAFLVVTFILPLGSMFYYAVDNPEVRTGFPRTLDALGPWNGEALPPDDVARIFSAEVAGAERPVVADTARRLNYEISGYRSSMMKTARTLRASGPVEDMAALAAIDDQWTDPATWRAMRRAGSALTPYYMLAAFDLKAGETGGVERVPPEQRLFVATLGRTLVISFVVTGICLVLGFPMANLIATGNRRTAVVMLACVLVPFWTSLLVRTSAWIVILQREGLLNSLLQRLGVIDAPLELIFNRTGLYIAMVHILLPFMVLPILSVMKSLPPSYMHASASLGASPLTSFRRIYLPLTLPGIGAGCMLTFILSIGYYITPTLVGGASDQMLSYFVAFFTNTTLNWGMAAALGLVLLGCVLLIYVAIGRLVGIGRIVGME